MLGRIVGYLEQGNSVDVYSRTSVIAEWLYVKSRPESQVRIDLPKRVCDLDAGDCLVVPYSFLGLYQIGFCSDLHETEVLSNVGQRRLDPVVDRTESVEDHLAGDVVVEDRELVVPEDEGVVDVTVDDKIVVDLFRRDVGHRIGGKRAAYKGIKRLYARFDPVLRPCDGSFHISGAADVGKRQCKNDQ